MPVSVKEPVRQEPRLGAPFVARLRRRLAHDSGFAARLRRAAGTPLEDSRLLAEWYGFAEALPEPLRERPGIDVAFLVATLFAHDRRAYRSAPAAGSPGGEDESGDESETGAEPAGRADEDAMPGRHTFGATLADLRNPARQPDEDAMMRRLVALLDAEMKYDGARGLQGSLPWRLRQAVTLAVQRGARVDWALLLEDLLRWLDPAGRDRVRDAWAREYSRGARAAPGSTGDRDDMNDTDQTT